MVFTQKARAAACDAAFPGAGNMQALCRNMEWDLTCLGPVEDWSEAFCALMRVCFSIGFPMIVFAGRDRLMIYNDFYSELSKRSLFPDALGEQGFDICGNLWNEIKPDLEDVARTGTSTHHENQSFDFGGDGVVESIRLSYSVVALKHDDSPSFGVFVIFHELEAPLGFDGPSSDAGNSRFLLRLSDALFDSENAAEMQSSAARLLCGHLNASSSFFNEYFHGSRHDDSSADGHSEQSRIDGHYCFDEQPSPSLNRLRAGLPIVVADINDPRCPDCAVYKVHNLRAFILVPIVREHSLVAVLNVNHHVPRDWSDNDVELAQQSAERTWRYVTKNRANALEVAKVEQNPASPSSWWQGDAEQLVAILGHELKSPLAAIQHTIEILQRIPDQSCDGLRARQILARQSEQMAHLVDSLLSFVGMARRKIELQKENFDAREIIRAVIEDQRYQYDDRRLRLVFHPPHDPVWLCADRLKVTQILINLLNNAAKYTEKGGVYLTLRVSGESAYFSVRDTGVGVQPEVINKLFEPFHQERGSGKRKPGLGLGLAITKALVELHGGKIRARSAGPGLGTEFVFELPLNRH